MPISEKVRKRICDVLEEAYSTDMSAEDTADWVIDSIKDLLHLSDMNDDLKKLVQPFLLKPTAGKPTNTDEVVRFRRAVKKLGFNWKAAAAAALNVDRILSERKLFLVNKELEDCYKKRTMLERLSEEFDDTPISPKLIIKIGQLEAERRDLLTAFPDLEVRLSSHMAGVLKTPDVTE